MSNMNSFENWEDFKTYVFSQQKYSILNTLNLDQQDKLNKIVSDTYAKIPTALFKEFTDYKSSKFNIFNYFVNNENSIILSLYDKKPIVLTSEYPAENLISTDFIYVISHPENIRNFKDNLSQVQKNSVDNHSQVLSLTDKLNDQLWQKMNSQHETFSELARKKFDAYVVLRINKNNETEVYKMDTDLEKEMHDKSYFKFSLKEDAINPFTTVLKSQMSESISLSQFNKPLLDFKYACITSLKVGSRVVGFLVGLKASHLSQDDITTLESLSEKAV